MAAHDEFDDFFGDDNDAPVVDTRADGRLLRIPLGRLAPNGVNPRTDFGTEAELIDLGKSLRRRQIQACPAVSRSAYLKLWPDHAKQIGDVDYVLVTGERRYRGATAASNPALNCVVDDGLAKDRKTFMEAVVSENVDRQNFNPVEEAYAVQALVAEFGSNRAVAQHFERVDGWVTQRILLTHLAPEVQDLVRKKTMPLEAARSLGKLARDNEWDATKQLAWWQDEQKQRTAASAERSAAKKAAKRPPLPPLQQVRRLPVLTSPGQTRFTAVKRTRPTQRRGTPLPRSENSPPARRRRAHQSFLDRPPRPKWQRNVSPSRSPTRTVSPRRGT
ncbi:ParB/RepB/Spo0J family partition protein [Kitasatospora aburaviensis]